MNRILLCVLLTLVGVAGCRIVQQPGIGGSIESSSGLYDCQQGPCVSEISGSLAETFTAVPDAGFEFVTWKWLCSHQTTAICDLILTPDFTQWDIDVPQVALFAPIAPDDLATDRVVIESSIASADGTLTGYIVIELFGGVAPGTVANFLDYVNSGSYDGVLWHRIINNFVIQTGTFRYDTEIRDLLPIDVNDAIPGEFSVDRLNERGTLAMALPGNSAGTNWDGATSSFFINLVHNSHLDPGPNGEAGFTVFGRVVAGMDVVDLIASTETFSNDVPRWIVEMTSVTHHPL